MVTSDGGGLTGGLTSGLAGAGGISGGGLMASSSGGLGDGMLGGGGFRNDYGGGGDAGTALSKLRSSLATGLQGGMGNREVLRGSFIVLEVWEQRMKI